MVFGHHKGSRSDNMKVSIKITVSDAQERIFITNFVYVGEGQLLS